MSWPLLPLVSALEVRPPETIFADTDAHNGNLALNLSGLSDNPHVTSPINPQVGIDPPAITLGKKVMEFVETLLEVRDFARNRQLARSFRRALRRHNVAFTDPIAEYRDKMVRIRERLSELGRRAFYLVLVRCSPFYKWQYLVGAIVLY